MSTFLTCQVKRISTSVPVVGNGMGLGIMDSRGTSYGMALDWSSTFALHLSRGGYGQPAGSYHPPDISGVDNGEVLGVTSDTTKSGIVANLSDTNIGEVNSLKLGKYILKY